VTTNGEDERFESSRVRRERFHHEKNKSGIGVASVPHIVTIWFIFWRASVLFQETRRTAQNGSIWAAGGHFGNFSFSGCIVQFETQRISLFLSA
jgi:hypothetical protein